MAEICSVLVALVVLVLVICLHAAEAKLTIVAWDGTFSEVFSGSNYGGEDTQFFLVTKFCFANFGKKVKTNHKFFFERNQVIFF